MAPNSLDTPPPMAFLPVNSRLAKVIPPVESSIQKLADLLDLQTAGALPTRVEKRINMLLEHFRNLEQQLKHPRLLNNNIDSGVIDASTIDIQNVAYEVEDLLDGNLDKLLGLPISAGGGSVKRFKRLLSNVFGAPMKSIYSLLGDLHNRLVQIGKNDWLKSMNNDYRPRGAAPLLGQESDQIEPSLPLLQKASVISDDAGTSQFELIFRSLKYYLLQPRDYRCIIIGLVGPAGVGKTMIAQKVYNDMAIASHFDFRAWFHVGTSKDGMALLRQLMGYITKLPYNVTAGMDKWELIKVLQGYLRTRRYLIVVDDVWNLECRNVLQLAFPINEKGRNVIVTTRVAAMVHYEPRFEINKPLMPNAIFRLFASMLSLTTNVQSICVLLLRRLLKLLKESHLPQ